MGFFYLLLKAGIFVTLILEYQNRQEWLNSRSIHKDIPDIWIFWSRIISILICGCFMPFLVFNNQTKRTCLSIWNTNKTPSVVPSTFPTVAYTQTVQNMVSVFYIVSKVGNIWFFVSSRSVKMRKFSFLSLCTFWRKCFLLYKNWKIDTLSSK